MIKEKNLPTPEDLYPVRRALLSVSDKTDLIPFATRLNAMGIQLISTGGTARAIREAGLPVTEVAEITNFPEILDGRVKTLHPAIHGGLLSRKNDPDDKAELAERIDAYVNQRLPEELCVDSLMKLYLHCVCFHMSDFFEQVHLIIAIFLFTSYLNIDYHSVRFQERIN